MSSRTQSTSRRLWYAIAAGSLIAAISLGVRSTFGLYLNPISDALQSPRAVFALAVAIQNLVWGLGQPVAGAMADRFGAGRVLVAGAGVYAGGMALMAGATTSTTLYLSGGFIVGLGMSAASFSVVLASISRLAPPERRSMALGIATAMGSAGQFILIPLAQRWLDTAGWEATILWMAAITAVIALLVWPLRGNAASSSTSDAPDEIAPLRQELRRAGQSRSYLLLNAGFFVCGFHVTFIGTHLAAYVEDLGLAGTVGATALALIGLFNIVGSFTAGALGAKHSKTRLLSVIYAARAVVITGFVLIPATAQTTAVFGALIGLLWLATVPLTSGIVLSQFGPAHAGTLFGIVFLSHQVGSFFGAWLGGRLADATGSYAAAWWLAVALGLFAAVVHLFIDDGPAAPARPAGARRWRLAPTVGALVIAAVVVVAPFAGVRQSVSADVDPHVFLCPIHPTILR